MRLFLPIIVFGVVALAGCKQQNRADHPAHFTKVDSLTDVYLSLQDSLHKHWNLMINDDNQKLNAMHHLLHELLITHPEKIEQYTRFEERLEQLARLRYTQKSMINEDVVQEYDFASAALIIELIAAAESTKEYSYNSTLQKLVNHILTADQNMVHYRTSYDSIVLTFNSFIDENSHYLSESGQDLVIEKKPFFQVTSVKKQMTD